MIQKITFSLTIAFFSLFTLCQAQTDTISPASIFEIGRKIQSCEDNFYNLFRNWKREYIQNADSIRLIAYEYFGTVHDRNSLRLYADLLNDWDYPMACFRQCRSSDAKNNYIEMIPGTLREYLKISKTQSVTPDQLRELAKMRHFSKQAYRKSIPIGSKVYKLYLEQTSWKYSIFIFFDPVTHRVVGDNMFMHIPTEFIQNMNSQFTDNPTNELSPYWEKQLQIPITTPDPILSKNKIALINYTLKYTLESEEQLLNIEKEFFKDSCIYPVMDSGGEKLTLLPVRNIKMRKDSIYDFDFLLQNLDAQLSVGMKVLELQWKYQGQPFTTLCIADDQLGVIYDPILSHVITFLEKKIILNKNVEPDLSGKQEKTVSFKVHSLLGDLAAYLDLKIQTGTFASSGHSQSLNQPGLVYMPQLISNLMIKPMPDYSSISYVCYVTTGKKSPHIQFAPKGKANIEHLQKAYPGICIHSGTSSLTKKDY